MSVDVIILSGPPGVGKSTIARELARRYPKAVHVHTDDFWHYIVSGGIPPYERAADGQNHAVMAAIAGAARAYALGGYTAIVDGVIGPWMLSHFRDQIRHPDHRLHYVVLRADRDVTLSRAQHRAATGALTRRTPLLQMWDAFADLGDLESHVLNTSGEDLQTSLRSVVRAIDSQRFVLGEAQTAGTDLAEVLRVLGALDAAGARYWLEGGWGVDALVGHQTRPHRDIDIDIDSADEQVALSVLADLGYAVGTDWRPNRVELAAAGHGWVDLHPLLFDESGSARQAALGGGFHVFPPSFFTAGALAGRPVPCVSNEAQRLFHTGYESRAIDIADLTILEEL